MHKQHELVHEFLLENDFKSFTDYEGYTLKRGPVSMKLDHIYCKNATVTNCGVEKEIKLSDHKPVWAEVEIL
jgi:endonuclease/exonuclease/phosphatase family metal-dependent hydrolase